MRGSQGVSALGNNLFGDRVDLYTGALSFQQTDVSLPGNNALPVAVGRKYSAGRPISLRGQFGNWDLDIPHLYGNFSTQYGWVAAGNSTARCSNFGAPGAAISTNMQASWGPENYWSGNFLSAPGAEGQEILTRSSVNTTVPTDGNGYPLVTRGNWQIRCLSSLANGAGEGFLALSPDGTQYRFDWMVSRFLRPLQKASSYLSSSEVWTMSYLARSEVWLMPTLIRDRFGNTVTYTWDATAPWNLTKIESSDGRKLNFNYLSGSLISSVSDGTRTWSYTYAPDGAFVYLSTVTQPDGGQWTFDLKPLTYGLLLGVDGSCSYAGDYPTYSRTGTMTHPSGALGTFTTSFVGHGRIGAPYSCLALADRKAGSATYPTYAIYPRGWYTQALQSKTINGPGVAAETWSYGWVYGETNDPSCCTGSKNVYAYDTQGNITGKGTQGYYFDQGNRLVLANGIASYSYDGLGHRVYAISATTPTYKSSVYSQAGQLLYGNVQQGMTSTSTRYIYLGNKLIAEDGSAGILYSHTDALGSPVATSNSAGTLLSNTWYEAYGKTAAGTNPQGIGFTGHVNDAVTGLVYMQQRYYDPIAGRFMSVDPVTTDANTGSSFNRYVYANNNPYGHVDPDGKNAVKVFIAIVRALMKTEGKEAAKSGGKEAAKNAATAAEKTRTTYTRERPDGTVYSGKTSGKGTPEEQVANRTNKPDHKAKTEEGYGPATVDKNSTDSEAIRGREQQLIERNGGAQSKEGTSGNKINSVSEGNPKAADYQKAAEKEFGS